MYVRQRAALPLGFLSSAISVFGVKEAHLLGRSLVESRSLRLLATMPVYLFVKYVAFASGYLFGYFEMGQGLASNRGPTSMTDTAG
jgi:hypothetical protein